MGTATAREAELDLGSRERNEAEARVESAVELPRCRRRPP